MTTRRKRPAVSRRQVIERLQGAIDDPDNTDVEDATAAMLQHLPKGGRRQYFLAGLALGKASQVQRPMQLTSVSRRMLVADCLRQVYELLSKQKVIAEVDRKRREARRRRRAETRARKR